MKLAVLSDHTFELTPSMLMQIGEAAPAYDLEYRPAETVSASFMADTEILFGCPPVQLLSRMPFLEWHHLPNSGIEPYVRPDLYANPGVVLTNSRGVYGAAIAEHVVGMVFALARCFPLYERQRRDMVWRRDDFGCVWVEDSTVSVFGLGDLGSNIAKKLKTLGARVIGVRRSLLEKPPYVDELCDLRSAADVMSRSDFVICCLPWTRHTTGLFSAELLGVMKQSAYFINVSRGALVDTDALTSVLREGRIAGAALDVTEPEPLPEGHALWSMPNVILTPHASCVCGDVQERKLSLFVRMLKRYVEGRRLPNQVSFLDGY